MRLTAEGDSMRGIVISLVLSAALWIGLALLSVSVCTWLEAATMSPLVIALMASLFAIVTSAAAVTMWILSTWLDEDDLPAAGPWPSE